jgi:hypothetical protein
MRGRRQWPGHRQLRHRHDRRRAERQQYHNRMPVVLDNGQFDDWMRGSPEQAAAMMKPYVGELEAWEVGPEVGNVRNNRPELMERAIVREALWRSQRQIGCGILIPYAPNPKTASDERVRSLAPGLGL